MSPNLRKCLPMDTSGVTTRKRAKASNLRNKNSIPSQDFEKDIENEKKIKIDLSPKKNQQSTARNSLNERFPTRNASSEQSKKSNTSNRFRITKSLKPKTNKSIVYNDSVSNIENISCELISDSSLNLDVNNEPTKLRNLSLNKTITPKSSPISVTLTPQRTTKTPKKSPLHLNSPKTHSRISLTTSRTPRKLMLSVHSPTAFNSSEISSKKRKNNDESILNNVSMSNVKVKSNQLNTIPKGIHSSSKKISKLSKSPKIVLRSPKKSKSKSPRMGLSSEKKTSFVILKANKSPKRSISTRISNRSRKNSKNNRSLSSEADDLDVTLKNSNDLSALCEEILSKQPVVILERIPLLENLNRSSKPSKNQHPMNSTFDIKEIEKQLPDDSDFLKTSPSDIKYHEKEGFNDLNLITSPYPRRKSHLNCMLFELSAATSSPLINKRRQRSSIGLNLTDKTNKSYDNSKDDTSNVNEKKTNIADETYELLEPKTPRLQERCRKRKAEKRSPDDERNAKRACKVHFAASESCINRSKTTILDNKNTNLNSSILLSKPEYVNSITINKTPIVRSSHKMSSSVSSSSANKSKQNSRIERTPLFNNSRKIGKAPSSTLNKTKLIENQEKKDIKVYSAKKIPNFSGIHKKLFSKMESLVDNKIRMRKQYEALKSFNVPKSNTRKSVQPLAAETKRDGYNRFGFKIRKPEATNIILRKQPPNRQKEKREENRMLLKGVRTNRRFELQMKMRNLSN